MASLVVYTFSLCVGPPCSLCISRAHQMEGMAAQVRRKEHEEEERERAHQQQHQQWEQRWRQAEERRRRAEECAERAESGAAKEQRETTPGAGEREGIVEHARAEATAARHAARYAPPSIRSPSKHNHSSVACPLVSTLSTAPLNPLSLALPSPHQPTRQRGRQQVRLSDLDMGG
ncbi:unnamed protein product [Closterium sp. Naga37s-1]|nr:unnamed protein product [Closterium sp. Naga37s-1]